ncbi:methionine adenosyltransferase domain-containing protein, partial [Staphylococcus epidermidis]|uniref:methionine adenosyltransferase domain-containing protein n=1 Tax=Staphylococcus epidermidis TaxID=1282 RepID=UPI0037D9A99D
MPPPQPHPALTPPKIILHTYPPYPPHPPPSFTPKHPTKLHPSPAYPPTYVSKNIVPAPLAKQCEL